MSKHTLHCPTCNKVSTYPLPEVGKIFCMSCNVTFVCAACMDGVERLQAPHEKAFNESDFGKKMKRE